MLKNVLIIICLCTLIMVNEGATVSPSSSDTEERTPSHLSRVTSTLVNEGIYTDKSMIEKNPALVGGAYGAGSGFVTHVLCRAVVSYFRDNSRMPPYVRDNPDTVCGASSAAIGLGVGTIKWAWGTMKNFAQEAAERTVAHAADKIVPSEVRREVNSVIAKLDVGKIVHAEASSAAKEVMQETKTKELLRETVDKTVKAQVEDAVKKVRVDVIMREEVRKASETAIAAINMCDIVHTEVSSAVRSIVAEKIKPEEFTLAIGEVVKSAIVTQEVREGIEKAAREYMKDDLISGAVTTEVVRCMPKYAEEAARMQAEKILGNRFDFGNDFVRGITERHVAKVVQQCVPREAEKQVAIHVRDILRPDWIKAVVLKETRTNPPQ